MQKKIIQICVVISLCLVCFFIGKGFQPITGTDAVDNLQRKLDSATARTKKLEQSLNEQQAILERDAEHLEKLSNIINDAYSIVEESVRGFESAGHEIRDARELLRRCIETQSTIIEQFERIEDYNRAIKGEQ